MKKVGKLILMCVAVMLLCFGVSACGAKEFDAAGYTKACFDANFKQDYDNYAKFRNLSKEEAKEEVEKLNRESLLSGGDSLGLTDAQKESFYQATMKCYSKAKYKVGEAKKGDDDNYTVSVSYNQMDCFTRFADEFQEECAKRPEILTDQSKIADFMNEFLAQCADEVTYGDEQTLDIVIAKNGDMYQMAQDQLLKADAAFTGSN